MPVVSKGYQPEKTINLYGDEERELWEALEAEIREETGADANEGEIAAQAFAAFVGREGPLDGETV